MGRMWQMSCYFNEIIFAISLITVISHAVLPGDVPWDVFQKFSPVMWLEGAGFGSKEQQHCYCYPP